MIQARMSTGIKFRTEGAAEQKVWSSDDNDDDGPILSNGPAAHSCKMMK